MKQTALLVEKLDGGKASVAVSRSSACGGNCGSCGTCVYGDGTRIIAENTIDASPGSRVVIESSTGLVFRAAFLAYTIPVVFLVCGYAAGYLMGLPEGACVLCSFSALAVCIAGIVALQRRKKNITYRITGFSEKEQNK